MALRGPDSLPRGQHATHPGRPLASPTSLAGKTPPCRQKVRDSQVRHSQQPQWPGLCACRGPPKRVGNLIGRPCPWEVSGLSLFKDRLLSTRAAIAVTVLLFRKYPGPECPLGKMFKVGKQDCDQLGCQGSGSPARLSPQLSTGTLHRHTAPHRARTFPNQLRATGSSCRLSGLEYSSMFHRQP